jgi:hypothetical protein
VGPWQKRISGRLIQPQNLDDGQPDLPSGGHAGLPGGGQRDYLV